MQWLLFKKKCLEPFPVSGVDKVGERGALLLGNDKKKLGYHDISLNGI